MKNKKQPTIEQLETTNRTYDLRKISGNDDELSELIGTSKVTLYTRLRLNNWKKPEMFYIEHLHSNMCDNENS